MDFFDHEIFLEGFELLFSLGGLAVSIVFYVFQGLALSTLRTSREFHPYGRKRDDSWKAWIPFANAWLLGDIADDINRFRGKRSRWRMWMLLAQLVPAGLLVAAVVVVIAVLAYSLNEVSGWEGLGIFLIGLVAAYVAVILISILSAVLIKVAQGFSFYAIFKDYDPQNAVLYLVLSLVLNGSIFLFIIRSRASATLYWAGRPAPPPPGYPPYPPYYGAPPVPPPGANPPGPVSGPGQYR